MTANCILQFAECEFDAHRIFLGILLTNKQSNCYSAAYSQTNIHIHILHTSKIAMRSLR